MTVEHDQKPLTRREIRERERSAGTTAAAAAAAPTTSRRAATASTTTAGEVPVLNASALRPITIEPRPSEAPELPVAAPVAPAADGVAAPERVLTRRELRALLAQQQAEQVAAVPDVTKDLPAETSGDGDVQEDALSSGETLQATESAAEGGEEPSLNTALFSSIGGTTLEDIIEEKPTEITGSFSVPIEHLHITEELDSKSRDDADATFDALIAHGVASTAAVTTTNALILPTNPSAPDAGRADAEEVLVTGSIDLPRSLGSTGQHPNLYDSPDVDRLFDKIDREQAPADSVPVRASSAISTHTSTRGVIAPQQKSGVSLHVVLAVTAAALLVGVIVLLVGGFVLNIF